MGKEMLLLRKRLALAGGLLVIASGSVSILIGAREGLMRYEPDPGGLFGHVGVLAGAIAVVIGGILTWIALHEPDGPRGKVATGLFTVVLGHLGAVAGALLVGTAGMVLCYVSGIWLVVKGVRPWRQSKGSVL
jgi:hypothetical protein